MIRKSSALNCDTQILHDQDTFTRHHQRTEVVLPARDHSTVDLGHSRCRPLVVIRGRTKSRSGENEIEMATKNDISVPSTSSDPFDPFGRSSATDNEPSAKPKFEGDKFASNSTSSKMSQSQSGTKSGSGSPDFQGFVGVFGSPLCCHAIRLQSGQEFRKTLMDFVSVKKLKAPFIMSCVGSALSAKLRLANATAEDTNYLLDLQGPLEIISVNGTFSSDGKCHLHASLANSSGKVHGGHLIELIVHTTAEVIIGECTAMKFERVHDKQTGFPELVVKER